MTLSWENGQFRTSIHITEFASHYRYYLINVFWTQKPKLPWIVSKNKEKNRIHQFKTLK